MLCRYRTLRTDDVDGMQIRIYGDLIGATIMSRSSNTLALIYHSIKFNVMHFHASRFLVASVKKKKIKVTPKIIKLITRSF